MKIDLRYPATPENARDHALLAVDLGRDWGTRLDFSPGSLEDVDGLIETLREDGLSGEDAAETLFILGCYVGQVMVKALRGKWQPTPRTALADISPWPMVVVLPGGSAWDPIGKAYKRLELGDSEYLPAYFAAAAGSRR
jgi:hypothetical protein